MKTLFLNLLLVVLSTVCRPQSVQKDSQLSPEELKIDLDFLKQQIYGVHNYPYTELDSSAYGQLFNLIALKLKGSLTATDFLKLLKPVIAHLSDEHAQISLKTTLLTNAYQNGAIYLPFNLQKKDKYYIIGQVFGQQDLIKPGDKIKSVNHIPIAVWLQKCALFSSGFPAQRYNHALNQFGYLVAWAGAETTDSFMVGMANGKAVRITGTTLAVWNSFLNAQSAGTGCEERLTYQRYGHTGYINACSFDVKPKGPFSLDSINNKTDIIFKAVKIDGVTSLIIDVSHNEGGNSAVGDYIIDHIYSKPYLGYQSTWKRSDEYLKLLKSWGLRDSAYEAVPVGKMLIFAPGAITPRQVASPFKGKVYVVVGRNTFSSAILFATLVKDNHIAVIAGQTPQNGHPNGFGELYNTRLPNSKIDLRFGVKEWIRPAGKNIANELYPDIILTDNQITNVTEMMGKLK